MCGINEIIFLISEYFQPTIDDILAFARATVLVQITIGYISQFSMGVAILAWHADMLSVFVELTAS